MPPPGDAIQTQKLHKGTLYERPTQGGDPPGHRRWQYQGRVKAVHVPSSVQDWMDGKKITWEDADLTFQNNPTDITIGNAYYTLSLSKTELKYTYTSRTQGAPFVSVELLEIGGVPIGSLPIPTLSGNEARWIDVTPGVDLYIRVQVDRIELRKQIKDASADRSFTWRIEESDPLPLNRQKVSKGHDNHNMSEPSRDGLGPGRIKRQVELTHTETPIGGAPAGQNWYTLEEEWTGNTWEVAPVTRIKSLSTDVVYPVDIDVLVEEEIAADGDDGYGELTSNTWNNSYASTNDGVAYGNTSGDHYQPGFRFVSVPIPKDATIDDATFAVERGTGSGTLSGTLDVSAEDDAAAWSSSNRPETKTAIGSGAAVTWTGTAGTDVSTTGLATDLQSLVNRAGWASNQALAIFDNTNFPTSGAFVYLEDEADADVGAARLDINYTASGDTNVTTNLETLSLTTYQATIDKPATNVVEVGQWTGTTTSLLPTTTWAAPNALFPTEDRNDNSTYSWSSSTSTVTLPSSGLADGYLFLWGYEFEDTSNGRHNPQGRMIQASGTGNFASAVTGGYNRDNSEDRSYVSGWSFVDSPSASSTYTFQWRRDADAPTGGTVRSFIQVVEFFYSDAGIYTSTSTTATGGTTPVQITGFSGTDGTNVTIASDTVSVTGDNKRYLCLGSCYHQGIGSSRTQRWYGFRVDGSKDDAAKGCMYYRNTSNADGGESFIRLLETTTPTRTIDIFQYRGDGVAAGQGGADVDGNTTGSNSQHALVVLELNDNTEVYSSTDATGAQELALAGPVDIDIASTGDIEFNDSASFTRSTDAGVNIEQDMDLLAFANVSHARESGSIGSGSRWTVHGEFTVDGTEQTAVGFHGNYNRGNQGSEDCHGSSCNQAGLFTVTTGQDIGVSQQELAGTEGGGGDIETQPGWVGFGLINLDTLEATGGDTNVAANTATLTLTEQQATVANDVNVTSSTASLTLAEQQATVALDVDVATNLATLTLTENASSIVYDKDVLANAASLTLTVNQATVANDVDIAANTVALSLTENQSTIVYDVDVLASAASLTLTENPATITYDVEVLANTDTLALTVYQATVQLGVNVDTSTAALTLTENPATVVYDVDVLAATASLSLTENPATVVYDKDVLANAAALTLTEFPADVQLGVNVLANAASLTLTENQATVVYDVDVATSSASLALTANQATVALDYDIQTSNVALTMTEYASTIVYDVDVPVNVATLTLTEYPATVVYDVNVLANNVALALTENPATVSLDVDIGINAASMTLTTHQASVDLSGAAGATMKLFQSGNLGASLYNGTIS